MESNMPVVCPQCGEQMELWRENKRLDLSVIAPDWVRVDVYSCPGCGHLAFFRSGFVPRPKKHVPVEPEPTGVDTTSFYVPGVGEMVKCPVCGKEHPRDDAFCPLCGTRRDQPCPWWGRGSPAEEEAPPHCGGGRKEE